QRGGFEIQPPRFRFARCLRGKIKQRKSRSIVAHHEKFSRLPRQGFKSVQLRRSAAGKRQREPLEHVETEHLSLFATGQQKEFLVPGDAIKSGAVAGGERFGISIRWKPDER